MARRKTSNVHTTKATTTAAQKVEATKAVVEEKAVEVKEAVKETAAKAEEAAKETVEKAAEKATEAAAEVKETKKRVTRKPTKKIVLQYLGKEFDEAELTERAIAQFNSVEGGVAVKTITMYLKPEEDAAYYVINDQYTGRVDF